MCNLAVAMVPSIAENLVPSNEKIYRPPFPDHSPVAHLHALTSRPWFGHLRAEGGGTAVHTPPGRFFCPSRQHTKKILRGPHILPSPRRFRGEHQALQKEMPSERGGRAGVTAHGGRRHYDIGAAECCCVEAGPAHRRRPPQWRAAWLSAAWTCYSG